MSDLKVIAALSEKERAEIDAKDPDPCVYKCGECGAGIRKSTEECLNSSKYCPVFR